MSVHAGTAITDVALPAGVPVATLIPSIVDLFDGPGALEARSYRLSRPGTGELFASATLAQNGIRDGAVLVLTQAPIPPPAPRYDDVAEGVSATLGDAARPSRLGGRQAARLGGAVAAGCLTGVGALALARDAFDSAVTTATAGVTASAGLVAVLCAAVAHRAYGDATAGLALGVIATAFAAVGGFLAVPGAPGPPHVVLAAAAAVATSVLAMRVSGCGVVTLTALSCGAAIIAVAAFVGVLTAAPPRAIGAITALVSVGLLGAAARASIVLAGISPQGPPAPDLDARAIRARGWSTSLRAGLSSAAAVGAVVTVLAGAPGVCGTAFGALTGVVLLLRARSDEVSSALVLSACGIITAATTFGAVALSMPPHGAWTAAATATLAAAAIYLGFAAPAMSLSPVLARGVAALECAALVAMVPMTCWVCGAYGAVRGLSFT